MKKLINVLATVLITAGVFAQAPQKMSYQAVIRNNSNALITSTVVGMQISILQGSATGTPFYVETQTPMTNANGLVSLEIGSGTIVTGTLAAIDWAAGPYFIKTETDPAGGTTYTITGTSQLLSVPYALFSANGGVPGPKGDSGATGLQGIQGIPGPKGDSGATGSFPYGNATGDMQYWNGTQWVMIPVGANEQTLTLCDGIPHWGPCPVDTSGSDTTVTDNDGNIYNTVTIGTQVWMKENLKVTKYRNGDSIPTTTSASIPNDSTSKYQWAYNNDTNNVATYGRLYTWYAVTDSRNVCPVDWHVPSDAEWCTLENFVEVNTDSTCNVNGWRGTNTGGKMKEAGTSHWNSPNIGADNSSGFTALPGGYRYTDGTFYYVGDHGDWWSVTEFDATNAWYRNLHYNLPYSSRFNNYKSYGFSVRCVRD